MSGAWEGKEGPLAAEVVAATQRALAAYSEDPTLVQEHVNIELATAEGGYERRQVFELVQNAADALLKAPDLRGEGRIEVLLTDDALYCANEGQPVDQEGLTAILHSHLSSKRGFEIGRFGLGFKSVLAVTDRPMVLSRSVSFEFVPDQAATLIRERVPSAEKVPVLRVAQPVDPETAASKDPLLESLMTWATTVVKLPRTRPDTPHLAEDLRDFPAEFLLFSPHVGSVSLKAEVPTVNRRIVMKELPGDVIELTDGRKTQQWRVLSAVHRFTPEALQGAGEFSEREEVQLHWAVPVGPGAGRGKFWAFFPTHYDTTLSGVLNAPWKTQEDRQNLLEGGFNKEMIDVAASLIVSSCAALSSLEDPAVHLDKFPARGRESPNWADAQLTEKVYDWGANFGACLPDSDGILQTSARLLIHPKGLPEEALRIWAAVPGRPSQWCHWSVETRDRRPRAERLLAGEPRRVMDHGEWLHAILSVGTVEASAAAIRILALLGDDRLTARTKAILTTSGSWVAVDPQRVFRLDENRVVEGLHIVDPEVVAIEGVRPALEQLRIRPLDALGELDAAVANSFRGWEADQWTRFWELMRRIEPPLSVALLNHRSLTHQVQARTRGGTFRRVLATLLPGRVLDAASSSPEDAGAELDLEFHASDLLLLEALGAVEGPRGGTDVTREAWFPTYSEAQRDAYLGSMTGSGPRPMREYLEFDQRESVGPLAVLPALSGRARAAFTAHAMAEPGARTPWTLRHKSNNQYPRLDVPNPTVWMLRQHGAVSTSRGVVRCREAFGPALHRFRDWLPVAELDEASCEVLGIQNDPTRVKKSAWLQAIEAITATGEARELGALYAAAAQADVPVPRVLYAAGNSEAVDPREIKVLIASDGEGLLVAEATGEPHVLVDEPIAVEVLEHRWAMRRAEPVLVEVVAVDGREPEPAADLFPLLPLYVGDRVSDIVVVRAAEVEVRYPTAQGTATLARDSHWDGKCLVVDDDLDDRQVLEMVLEHAGVDLPDTAAEEILEGNALSDVENLKSRCRATATDAERLLFLIDTATLRKALPVGLAEAVVASRDIALSDLETAQLVLATHGIDVLRYFTQTLESRLLRVPTFNGGPRARRFVADLGFPASFAGARPETRDPLLRVPGPPEVPPLHEYQRELVDEIRNLVREAKAKRGLLSLPTGAGKTRVAAEAIIDAVREGELGGPIVWVAQSDELCEQAVQTWSYLWRAFGNGGTLAISRLWGGNDVEQANDELQVVIGTVHKLNLALDDPDYDWIAETDCVVVDEAHASTTPMYTSVLNWLGVGGRTQRRDCSLLGLTATPFRGMSESETERLAARYGRRRLDIGVLGDDPYQELQRLGVLAKVEHRLLGGSKLELTATELSELDRLKKLPKSAEQRLGEDKGRNQTLLDEVTGLPDDWPCLLFCTSVQHAELMAALLTFSGVPARAISGATDANRRRHAIEEFRQGRIRVLTNYGVLTQGFDAPMVQAIIVGRPTYSPNVYQQMIGRGLRGPANGGSDTCLIVNVEDTVDQFGTELAFRQFEHIWSGS